MDADGPTSIQVLRSSDDWSLGILTEHSIQNAYVEAIREANHCIYIENQFFITATKTGTKVTNVIGAAIVERILSAATAGRRFKVVVIIPTIPCFAGELDEAAGIRCIMAYQYNSICRGGDSIMEQLERAGVDPHEYISFYNLRGYDRINYDKELIARAEKESGVSYHETQVAISRIFLGDHFSDDKSGPTVVKIRNPAEKEEIDAKTGKRKTGKVTEVALPKTVEEARDILKRFHDKLPVDEVRDSIASNLLHGQPSTKDEIWKGSEEDEKGECARL